MKVQQHYTQREAHEDFFLGQESAPAAHNVYIELPVQTLKLNPIHIMCVYVCVCVLVLVQYILCYKHQYSPIYSLPSTHPVMHS